MRAKLLDYNTGKHFDVSMFFDDKILEEAYVLRANRDIIEGIFADAYNTTKIVFEDSEALGYDGEYYLIGHTAKIKISGKVIEISEIAHDAIESIGKDKIYAHAVDVLGLPDGVARRVAVVVAEYSKLMKKADVEIKREILRRL